MAQKQISYFPLNEKFSRLSGHVPNYAYQCGTVLWQENTREVAFHDTQVHAFRIFPSIKNLLMK